MHSPAPAAGINVVAGTNVAATIVDAIVAAGNKEYLIGLAVKGKPFCILGKLNSTSLSPSTHTSYLYLHIIALGDCFESLRAKYPYCVPD